MNEKTIEKMKSLCGSEVEFITVSNNIVALRMPYCESVIEIEIEGKTDDEQLESFIRGVNGELEEMINHLDDCKLEIQ